MPRETMRWLPMVGRLLLPCEFSASTSTVRPIWPFLFHSAFFVLLRGPNLASSVQGHSGLHKPKHLPSPDYGAGRGMGNLGHL